MSGYSPASHEAYQSIDLQAAEAEVLAAIRKHFAERKFTRAELADAMKWSINRITGRVLSLHEKGILDESETTVACPITGGNAHQVWLTENAPRSPHCDGNLTDLPAREIASHGARSVVPYLPSHLSPTLAQAKLIVGDKQNAFYDVAREVIERGEQFRIWT